MPEVNGASAQQQNAPALTAMVQYTKDLSFENPNAPRSLGPQQKAPNISIQVNVNARQIAEADYEVELLLEGGGRAIPPAVMIECPAPSLPLRPQGRPRRGAQWLVPAALHRSDRFRR